LLDLPLRGGGDGLIGFGYGKRIDRHGLSPYPLRRDWHGLARAAARGAYQFAAASAAAHRGPHRPRALCVVEQKGQDAHL
jgi:hypothetical protein